VPSVAVVTPSYNQGEFLERTIQSVLGQRCSSLEYIVVDGCSTDSTAAVLDRYRDDLTLVVEPDNGQAHAVNKGIARTSSDIIGWLNSDDVYRPETLARVEIFFADNPDVDVVYGDADLIDTDDHVIGRYYTEEWNAVRLRERPFLCQPAVFFRRRMVDRFGGLDQSLHYTMDYEYWLRLASGGASFAHLPATFAAWRLHAAAKSIRDRLRVHAELNHMLKRYCRRIPDPWILTQTQAILEHENGRAFGSPLAFAVAVARVSARLSVQLNGSVSARLAASTLRTLAAGLVKTALRRPFVAPAL
jgi:glycosyltransferase involved in cell wall biosynthesis